MNLLTILAFAILFLQGEQPGSWLLVGEQDIVWTLAVVVLQPLLLGVAASFAARRAQRLLVEQPGAPEVAQRYHHRATLVLRTAAFGGCAAMGFLTRCCLPARTNHAGAECPNPASKRKFAILSRLQPATPRADRRGPHDADPFRCEHDPWL